MHAVTVFDRQVTQILQILERKLYFFFSEFPNYNYGVYCVELALVVLYIGSKSHFFNIPVINTVNSYLKVRN